MLDLTTRLRRVLAPLTRRDPFDHWIRSTKRELYLHRWLSAGPARRGTSKGRTFVIFNHNYDLDVAAYCEAETEHRLWVLDPFSIFNEVGRYFPPEQFDLWHVYGEGPMRDSIARFKDKFVRRLARRLVDGTRMDAFLTPSDTFFYLRPLIEELRVLGVPTIVQDKEGTIAPGAIMDDHAAVLAERYPPIADQYYFWSESHLAFWLRVGIDPKRAHILGQPRSDFFKHPRRWPSKRALGLPSDKRLVVVFTYDVDSYARSTEPNKDRPWATLRAEMHDACRRLAEERTDVHVVVKAHPQQADLEDVRREFEARPHPRVSLSTGAALGSHLIVNADAIVGFQSTAMIEAMLTDTPIFYAGWGPQHDKFSDGLIPIHRSGGCSLPSSRRELEEGLRAAMDLGRRPAPAELDARRVFTDQYFYHSDGDCAARVLDTAAQFLARSAMARISAPR